MRTWLYGVIVGVVVAVIGAGVGLAILVWVLKRILDTNSDLIDQMSAAVGGIINPAPAAELTADGVPYTVSTEDTVYGMPFDIATYFDHTDTLVPDPASTDPATRTVMDAHDWPITDPEPVIPRF